MYVHVVSLTQPRPTSSHFILRRDIQNGGWKWVWLRQTSMWCTVCVPYRLIQEQFIVNDITHCD